MANPHRGETELHVDGQTYTLAFDINAICDAEDQSGKAINEIMGDIARVSTLRMLLRSSLQKHHSGITVEQAGDIMGAVGIPATLTAITAALNLAFPKPKKGDKTNPR